MGESLELWRTFRLEGHGFESHQITWDFSEVKRLHFSPEMSQAVALKGLIARLALQMRQFQSGECRGLKRRQQGAEATLRLTCLC